MRKRQSSAENCRFSLPNRDGKDIFSGFVLELNSQRTRLQNI